MVDHSRSVVVTSCMRGRSPGMTVSCCLGWQRERVADSVAWLGAAPDWVPTRGWRAQWLSKWGKYTNTICSHVWTDTPMNNKFIVQNMGISTCYHASKPWTAWCGVRWSGERRAPESLQNAMGWEVERIFRIRVHPSISECHKSHPADGCH